MNSHSFLGGINQSRIRSALFIEIVLHFGNEIKTE